MTGIKLVTDQRKQSDEALFITGQDIAIDGGFCVGIRFEEV
jgi:hypothetical protein